MTMVRNITSHSERAAMVESVEYSNALSSRASRAAYLAKLLADGSVDIASVPRLLHNAAEFVKQFSEVVADVEKTSTLSFQSLIPVNVVVGSVDLDRSKDLPQRLQRALLDAESGNVDPAALRGLSAELEKLSVGLAKHVYETVKDTLGA